MPTIYDSASSSKQSPPSLNTLIESTHHVLCRCSSVFPFSLFPDTIILDENKIDIIYYNFFFTKYAFTVLIKDIKTVKLSTDPFFATISLEVEGYEDNPAPIRFLSKKCALRLHGLIVGLTTAKKEGVKATDLNQTNVESKIEEIGSVPENLTGI